MKKRETQRKELMSQYKNRIEFIQKQRLCRRYLGNLSIIKHFRCNTRKCRSIESIFSSHIFSSSRMRVEEIFKLLFLITEGASCKLIKNMMGISRMTVYRIKK